jgi:hypothetical protein
LAALKNSGQSTIPWPIGTLSSSLIQPLGEGSFDTYQLVKLINDNGYDGKFGLQCYNIKQDCEVALTKSIQTWQAYKKRYRENYNGPSPVFGDSPNHVALYMKNYRLSKEW